MSRAVCDNGEQGGYEIDIRVDDDRWACLLDVHTLAKTTIAAACAVIKPLPFSELSIALLNDKDVRQLNKTYRGKDSPTNVLSFSARQIGVHSPLLGDIVLGYETVAKEAREKKSALRDHVQHLLIHGFYHLNGYDHQNEQEAQRMEVLEIKALKRLGVANPYDIKAVL